jgi:hypothetical protein
VDQTTQHLQRVGDILWEIRDLLKAQQPVGGLYAANQVVNTRWREVQFFPPLFAITITNTGASSVNYRFLSTPSVIATLDPGDSAPFSASIPVFTGIEVRLDPTTTVQGSVRLTGVY